MEEIEEFVSARGSVFIVINSYKFVIHEKPRNEITNWRCSSRSCRARLWTRDKKIIKYNLIHNHDSDIKKITRDILRQKCKMKCKDNILQKPAEIVQEVLEDLKIDESFLSTNDILLVKQRMYRARRSEERVQIKYEQIYQDLPQFEIRNEEPPQICNQVQQDQQDNSLISDTPSFATIAAYQQQLANDIQLLQREQQQGSSSRIVATPAIHQLQLSTQQQFMRLEQQFGQVAASLPASTLPDAIRPTIAEQPDILDYHIKNEPLDEYNDSPSTSYSPQEREEPINPFDVVKVEISETEQDQNGESPLPEPLKIKNDVSKKMSQINAPIVEPPLKKIKLSSPNSSIKEEEIHDEFSIFGTCVAAQLRHLPLDRALKMQSRIQEMLSEERINCLKSQIEEKCEKQ